MRFTTFTNDLKKTTLLLLPILMMSNNAITAQCNGFIIENQTVGNTHFLRSTNQTLVVRGNYVYSMELLTNDKGIFARMVSRNGVEFNQDDEVIFVDATNTRKTYRFVGMSETVNALEKVSQNRLQLDLPALEWLSNQLITTIYIKSNA
ncbi:MAG: hypothetical protein RL329_3816, partial [Bacteroidota bacterium]